ncbi:MAG: hypothetical protein ACRDQX_12825 [Pseudonocardiaceae bacterium]
MDADLEETLDKIRAWVAVLEGGSDPVSRRAVAVEMRAWVVGIEERTPETPGGGRVPFWRNSSEGGNPF